MPAPNNRKNEHATKTERILRPRVAVEAGNYASAKSTSTSAVKPKKVIETQAQASAKSSAGSTTSLSSGPTAPVSPYKGLKFNKTKTKVGSQPDPSSGPSNPPPPFSSPLLQTPQTPQKPRLSQVHPQVGGPDSSPLSSPLTSVPPTPIPNRASGSHTSPSEKRAPIPALNFTSTAFSSDVLKPSDAVSENAMGGQDQHHKPGRLNERLKKSGVDGVLASAITGYAASSSGPRKPTTRAGGPDTSGSSTKPPSPKTTRMEAALSVLNIPGLSSPAANPRPATTKPKPDPSLEFRRVIGQNPSTSASASAPVHGKRTREKQHPVPKPIPIPAVVVVKPEPMSEDEGIRLRPAKVTVPLAEGSSRVLRNGKQHSHAHAPSVESVDLARGGGAGVGERGGGGDGESKKGKGKNRRGKGKGRKRTLDEVDTEQSTGPLLPQSVSISAPAPGPSRSLTKPLNLTKKTLNPKSEASGSSKKATEDSREIHPLVTDLFADEDSDDGRELPTIHVSRASSAAGSSSRVRKKRKLDGSSGGVGRTTTTTLKVKKEMLEPTLDEEMDVLPVPPSVSAPVSGPVIDSRVSATTESRISEKEKGKRIQRYGKSGKRDVNAKAKSRSLAVHETRSLDSRQVEGSSPSRIANRNALEQAIPASASVEELAVDVTMEELEEDEPRKDVGMKAVVAASAPEPIERANQDVPMLDTPAASEPTLSPTPPPASGPPTNLLGMKKKKQLNVVNQDVPMAASLAEPTSPPSGPTNNSPGIQKRKKSNVANQDMPMVAARAEPTFPPTPLPASGLGPTINSDSSGMKRMKKQPKAVPQLGPASTSPPAPVVTRMDQDVHMVEAPAPAEPPTSTPPSGPLTDLSGMQKKNKQPKLVPRLSMNKDVPVSTVSTANSAVQLSPPATRYIFAAPAPLPKGKLPKFKKLKDSGKEAKLGSEDVQDSGLVAGQAEKTLNKNEGNAKSLGGAGAGEALGLERVEDTVMDVREDVIMEGDSPVPPVSAPGDVAGMVTDVTSSHSLASLQPLASVPNDAPTTTIITPDPIPPSTPDSPDVPLAKALPDVTLLPPSVSSAPIATPALGPAPAPTTAKVKVKAAKKEKATNKKENAEPSVRKRKSEAALDGVDGEPKKTVKKRKTKADLKESEPGPTAAAAAGTSAGVHGSAVEQIGIPDGLVWVHPNVDVAELNASTGQGGDAGSAGTASAAAPSEVVPKKKRGRPPKAKATTEAGAALPNLEIPGTASSEKQQIALPTEQQVETTTPPSASTLITASASKKGGRKPKAATGTTDAGTPSTSMPTPSTAPKRKKKSPVDAVKQEQPIVKVEGTGTPAFDEEALLQAALANEFGMVRAGPRGMKKNQASASSGHQDIRWSLTPPEAYASTVNAPSDLVEDNQTRTPFVWTSSKEELRSAIPGLAKPLNGVSWLNIRQPVIVIEEDSPTGILKVDRIQEDKYTLTLTMTRDFSCPSELLQEIAPVQELCFPVPRVVPPNAVVPVTSASAALSPASTGAAANAHGPFPMAAGIGPSSSSSSSTSAFWAPHVTPAQEGATAAAATPSAPPPPSPFFALPARGPGHDDEDEESFAEVLSYPGEPETDRNNPARNLHYDWSMNNVPSVGQGVDHPQSPSSEGHLGAESNGAINLHSLNALVALLNNASLHSFNDQELQPMPVLPASIGPPVVPPFVPTTNSYQLPKYLPLEVVSILQCYISSNPIILVVSPEIIQQTLKITVKEECGLSYLGFFKITTVDEKVLPYAGKKAPAAGQLAGRVQWKFTCEWIASGEEVRACRPAQPVVVSVEEGEVQEPVEPPEESPISPWWSPTTRGKSKRSNFPSTPPISLNRHYVAHIKYPNRLGPDAVTHGRYWSMLPEYATAETTPEGAFGVRDESLPAGWHCSTCGKLNFQEMMRVRRCDSELCKKSEQAPKGYALALSQIRDPMQRALMSHPYNTYPFSAVEAFIDQWEDGMQTFSYISKADPSVSVKHVFTGNTPVLQQEATQLLEEVQLNVELKKMKGGNSPYFEYRVDATGDDGVWEKVPSCLTLARDVLVYWGENYGELSTPKIKKLSLSAWVTSGSKRATTPFSAHKHSIVMMFLGSEAILTLTPKSGLPDPPVSISASSPSQSVIIPISDDVQIGTSNDGDPEEDTQAAGPSSSRETHSVPVPISVSVDREIRIGSDTRDTEDSTSIPTRTTKDVIVTVPVQVENGDIEMEMNMIEDSDGKVNSRSPGLELSSYGPAVPPAMGGGDGEMGVGGGSVLMAGVGPVGGSLGNSTAAEVVEVAGDAPEPEPTLAAPAAKGKKGKGKAITAKDKSKETKEKKEKKEKPEKAEKRSIVVTMVHGDVLILSGDKFDYGIKRGGTGILLIGEQR